MRSAEYRTINFKEKISKTAKEYADRVPIIKDRFNKIQEMKEQNNQEEFTKMFRKYNNSNKRKEKMLNELKEKK